MPLGFPVSLLALGSNVVILLILASEAVREGTITVVAPELTIYGIITSIGLILWMAGMQLGLFYNLRYTGMNRLQKLRDHALVLLVTPFAGVIDTAGLLVAVPSTKQPKRVAADEVAAGEKRSMSSYQQQRETRSRIIFTVLIIAVTVGITYGLIRLTLPSFIGQHPASNNASNQTAEKREAKKDLPRGDVKRVADLDRLAAALKTYKEQHGGYPISTGTCAGGSFDSDADLGFLADLEREAVIDAIPRDPAGIVKATRAGQGTNVTANEDCDTMYGAKHHLFYYNGTKFALIASFDDADAIPDDAAGAYLVDGDREWFDSSALIADWRWSRNVYIVSNQKLAEAAKKWSASVAKAARSRTLNGSGQFTLRLLQLETPRQSRHGPARSRSPRQHGFQPSRAQC